MVSRTVKRLIIVLLVTAGAVAATLASAQEQLGFVSFTSGSPTFVPDIVGVVTINGSLPTTGTETYSIGSGELGANFGVFNGTVISPLFSATSGTLTISTSDNVVTSYSLTDMSSSGSVTSSMMGASFSGPGTGTTHFTEGSVSATGGPAYVQRTNTNTVLGYFPEGFEGTHCGATGCEGFTDVLLPYSDGPGTPGSISVESSGSGGTHAAPEIHSEGAAAALTLLQNFL